MKSRHPATVQQLAEMAMAETDIREEEVVQIVKEMETEGSLMLQEPLRDITSTWDYLRTPILSLWFWTALGATVLTTSVVLFVPDFFPIVVIRWLSGSILLFFLPGYALLHLLFPGREPQLRPGRVVYRSILDRRLGWGGHKKMVAYPQSAIACLIQLPFRRTQDLQTST
ncbi:MAG: hypothetical protein ABSF09_13645 [Candidatus Bathyarchaeia archaeon]